MRQDGIEREPHDNGLHSRLPTRPPPASKAPPVLRNKFFFGLRETIDRTTGIKSSSTGTPEQPCYLTCLTEKEGQRCATSSVF